MLKHTIDVVFRKYKKGDIIALFPYEIQKVNGNCLCYQHIGQHGEADYSNCIAMTVPATPTEYSTLRMELTNQIGYNMTITKKRNSTIHYVAVMHFIDKMRLINSIHNKKKESTPC